MFPFADFLQYGLLLGSIYGLSAVALALVWGIVGILNMAHGTFLVLAGYFSFLLISQLGIPWPVGIALAIGASGVVNVVFYQLLVFPIYRRKEFVVDVIILTIGLAIIIEAALTWIFTGYPRVQPAQLSGRLVIGDIVLAHQTILVISTGTALIALLHIIVNKTRLGRQARAISQDHEAAALNGIPMERVSRRMLLLGGWLGVISCIRLYSKVLIVLYVLV